MILLLFSLACEKEEIGIPAHDPGDVVTQQLEMGGNYLEQIFYRLENNSIASQNLKTDWDLGFEAGPDGWHIILNSSTGGAVANTGTTDFELVPDPKTAAWRWDVPGGWLDSTGIGDWRDKKEVYLIDRGYDAAGKQLGYRKIVFESVDETAYRIRYARPDGSDEHSTIVPKDPELNFVCFSFVTHKVAAIHPPSREWDLLFTQYIHLFKEPLETPYLVTGVLTNPKRIAVAVETEKEFSAITFEDVSGYDFSEAMNVIGYDWKFYDFDAGSYTVYPGMNYIIKTKEEIYYKLHFTDFYNDAGEKGAPRFEVQRL